MINLNRQIALPVSIAHPFPTFLIWISRSTDAMGGPNAVRNRSAKPPISKVRFAYALP